MTTPKGYFPSALNNGKCVKWAKVMGEE